MKIKRLLSLITIAVMVITGVAVMPFALPAAGEAQAETPDYTCNATLITGQPGVYKATAVTGANLQSATLGIPSVSKQNLASQPTTESPAMIMGAAVGYEKKTGPTEYEILAERVAPYSYFRYGIIDEQIKDADGNITTHKKLSGFDGSYYIIRVDLSDLLAKAGDLDGKFLHVRQEDNKAMMVAVGFDRTTYSNGMGSKTGSYSLNDNAKALRDLEINDQPPYFDVILYSSGKLTAGADAGQQGVANGDVKLSFYIDGTEDYHPGLVELDPNNMPTFPYTCKPDGPETADVTYQTETDYNAALLTKYYEDSKVSAGQCATSYLVKGSDLEIDVTVDDNEVTGDTPEFWSLTSAMGYQPYDSHTIKLICEVPVLEGLSISSTSGGTRDVILDVNSFDIQIANNTTQNTAGLTISSGANLTIKDGTNTSGAELAIGNNASMVIKNGGVLTIDETCTNEVEYDAGTVAPGETPPQLAIGEITVEDGGKLINRGVVNIEGAEAKPIDPSQADTQVVTDIKRADMFVNYGGTFENYGCLSLKGDLYVLGTLNNYGKYNDAIVAHDPDKGTTSYHRGIQVTWKDVVNDPNRPVEPGVLSVGMDADGNVNLKKRAVLNNYGDIVLCPGTFNLYGIFNNAGNLYLCTADEAIIPVINPNDPLEVERRVTLNPPKQSVFNSANGTVNNTGHIGKAKVELIHNGVLGALTPIADDDPTAPGTTHVVSGNTVQVITSADGSTEGTVAFIKSKNTKKVTVPATVTLYNKKFRVVQINSNAFKAKKNRKVTIGSNVETIQPNAFKGSKVTKLIVKSKKLTKAKVKGSLKGSKVKTVQVKVGKKKENTKYVKKYRKIFTKKNAGKKVTVRR